MGESVKFRALFTASNESVDNIVNKIKTFFQKISRSRKKLVCSIYYGKVQNVVQDFVYQEELYEIIITASMDNKDDNIPKICSLWCKEKLLPWLSIVDTAHVRDKRAFHRDVNVLSFAFGTSPQMNYFMQHYAYNSNFDKEILCSFYHYQKFFVLYLSINHTDYHCPSDNLSEKFKISYDSIARVLITDATPFIVYLQLNHPPYIFIEKECKVYTQEMLELLDTNEHNCDQQFQQKVWERNLSFGCKCNKSLCLLRDIGRTLTLKLEIKSRLRMLGIVSRLKDRCPNVEFYYTQIKDVPALPLDELQKVSFIKTSVVNVEEENTLFGCQYAWLQLHSQSSCIGDQLALKYSARKLYNWGGHLNSHLQAYMHRDAKALIDALFHIGEMVNKNSICDFESAFESLFHHYHQFKHAVKLPNGMCMVRRIIITPSRVILLPPVESLDNRIIREQTGTEYIIRVAIQDDDFSKLTFAVQYHSAGPDFMEVVVGNILRKGISIGNRHYEILAASNSQLREHGLWIYAKDSQGRTAANIRTWMGDFTRIKCVAKYMARMGQCFSTSDEAIQITIDQSNEYEIPDKKTPDGRFIFSDGIGKISSLLATEVREAKLQSEKRDFNIHHENSYKPSAFQIRYKGCKGMVAEDDTLPGRVLAIRPSMDKFKCENANKLEIVKISAPRQLFLNRPFITILEQLGVKGDVFLDLQKEMIMDLTDCLIYEDKAVEMLSNYLPLDIPFRKLLNCGIYLTEEPFFRSLLIAIYKYAIEKLKSKARIAVPAKCGRNMLGVMDETGTLEYGQVFVQYSEELGLKTSLTHVLEETVVVTKNPCMHPGDVMKLQAVDVPALHHIKDCIVFPARGKRPHPDEMAGSDLDGDEYVVIWMKDFIFPSENYPPMEYPSGKDGVVQSSIGVNDMIDFLCKYIQNDNIGTFANAHLAWADMHSDGIFSTKCMDIAKKYPYVLDFAKTGKTEYMKKGDKPPHYPDFMEKGCRNDSYRSKNVLGLLYRFSKNLDACVCKADSILVPEIHNIYLEYPGWENYIDFAQVTYLDYAQRITHILTKYNIQNEAEALSGFCCKVDNVHIKQMESAISVVKAYMIKTMGAFRYMFLQDLEKEKISKDLTEEEVLQAKYRRASAFYMVTYGHNASDNRILSFPWIISDILVEVQKECKKFKANTESLSYCTLLDYMDDILMQSFWKISEAGIDGECVCLLIFQNVIREWLVNSRINLCMFESKNCCAECFNRILEHFQTYTRVRCCSRNFGEESCSCNFHCSPSTLIIDFLKFYLSHVTEVGQCKDGCTGFLDVNLTSSALQTYASLAVTRKLEHCGIFLDEKCASTIHYTSVEEGEPMRISLSDGMKALVLGNLDGVLKILKQTTKVEDVQIIIENNRGTEYALVNCTGTSWQRYDLEELILSPNIEGFLCPKLVT